jgi:hypothetical protein
MVIDEGKAILDEVLMGDEQDSTQKNAVPLRLGLPSTHNLHRMNEEDRQQQKQLAQLCRKSHTAGMKKYA